MQYVVYLRVYQHDPVGGMCNLTHFGDVGGPCLVLRKQTRALQTIWAPDAVRTQLNQPCLFSLTYHSYLFLTVEIRFFPFK